MFMMIMLNMMNHFHEKLRKKFNVSAQYDQK
jgi:hypothetical protein